MNMRTTPRESHWPNRPLARLVLGVASLFVLLAGAPAAHAAAAALSAQPNIIVIMVDDLDTESLRTAIGDGLSTTLMPNLQRYVLAGGTDFRESFVSFSLCCPSRATYLTGQYPHNHGVLWNDGEHGGFSHFEGQDNTLPVWLQQAGYRTGHVGKYLNGYDDAGLQPPGWEEWHSLVGSTTYCMYDYLMSHNKVPKLYGSSAADYQTDVLAGLAEDFVRARASGDARPFFLSVTTLAPHLETQCRPNDVRPAPRHVGSFNGQAPRPPSFNEEDMSDKPVWMQSVEKVDPTYIDSIYRRRIESLRAVDDLIGRVGRALEATGQLERTAIIFTSDNGYLLGQHRIATKVLVYEESIRVPLMVRVPGLPGPASSSRLVLNNDLAPTIADLAGAVPGRAVDGRSLLGPVRDPAMPWRTRILVEHPATGETYLAPPYLAVRETNASTGAVTVYAETLATDGAQIKDVELYTLRDDPYQERSKHNDPAYAPALRRLHWFTRALASCRNGSCQVLEQ